MVIILKRPQPMDYHHQPAENLTFPLKRSNKSVLSLGRGRKINIWPWTPCMQNIDDPALYYNLQNKGQ